MNILSSKKECKILKINFPLQTKKRLFSLGIKEGEKVKIVHKCLSGVVIFCDGMEIALSTEIAENIDVENEI